MKQEKLNLYRIDMKYIRNLHNVDDRVSSVSPQIGKQHRIYVGTVVVCNEHKYLIPLSHPVEKHKKMSPRADFDKIIDKKGKLLGVLNYNLMIPVEDKQLVKINLKEDKRDTIAEKHYKQLCIDELKWCRQKSTLVVGAIMIVLGSLSSLGYGPLACVKIIGMQFLDFFDFLTNSVMMPIAALMTSLFVSKVVGVDRMEEEIRHGESKFRRKKIFVVMIKYLCPIFAIIILVSSVANAFGWISM